MDKRLKSRLKKAYYDPGNPGSFGGVDRLWREVGGSKENVKSWLEGEDTYTLHKPARKKGKRNRILVAGLDDQWAADLIDVGNLSKRNANIKFLLTVIDSLSKKAFVIPLKNKTGSSVIKGFEKIFKKGRQPRKLRTDMGKFYSLFAYIMYGYTLFVYTYTLHISLFSGKEFLNSPFQQFLKKKGIHHFTSKSDTKCAIVEHFNRTLMTRIWRYFTATNKQWYIHVLDSIVESYNKTRHSTTGVAPNDVNVMNGEAVWRKVYADNPTPKKPLYKVGHVVRLNKAKKLFEKGYQRNYTLEKFVINRVHTNQTLPEYTLKDLNDQVIEGRFLEFEIQRVKDGK